MGVQECSQVCCETTPIREWTSIDEHASLHEWSHPSSTGLVDRIRQLILALKGVFFGNSHVPSWHISTCINIFPRSIKATVPKNFVYLHSHSTRYQRRFWAGKEKDSTSMMQRRPSSKEQCRRHAPSPLFLRQNKEAELDPAGLHVRCKHRGHACLHRSKTGKETKICSSSYP